MDFEAAWRTIATGQRVRVSNGRPKPPGGVERACWRSHNHEGEVIDKIAGPPRAIRVQLDEQDGALVAYDVYEGSGNMFDTL